MVSTNCFIASYIQDKSLYYVIKVCNLNYKEEVEHYSLDLPHTRISIFGIQSTPMRDWIPEFPGLHKLIIPRKQNLH